MKMPSFKTVLQSTDERKRRQYRRLIQEEAKIGGSLFGPVAEGGRREFFCLDPHTWIWHEEWTDESGKHHVVTTRYDVRPSGVIKAQDGQPYRELTKLEARNFYQAAKMYNKRVLSELYAQTL
ncbi:MAG: hypothetical protein WBP26_00880 [Candidatus Saccharimonadales bacterium]